MIPLISFNEDVNDFPTGSVEMREACSPEIRSSLQTLFGATEVAYLGQGFNNAHHRLTNVPGLPDLVVRRMLAPVPVLQERMEREYQVLEYLAEAGFAHAPIPISRIALSTVDASPAYAMGYVGGSPVTLNPDTLRRLGSIVARLHRLPVPEFLLPAGTAKTPRNVVAELCANWKRNLETVLGMPSSYRTRSLDLLEVLPRRVEAIDWSDATDVLLHGDLGDHNVIDQGENLVLIDWEFAAVSDPTLDFIWLFGREGVGTPEEDAFFEGYSMVTRKPVPAAWRERLPLLKAVSRVELAIWAQSGINDFQQGRNHHFFGPDDLHFLKSQVARVLEVHP